MEIGSLKKEDFKNLSPEDLLEVAEFLYDKFDETATALQNANGTIGSLNEIIASAKSNGATPPPAAAGTPANAEVNGKVYVWKRKNFLLPVDPTRYTAEQANADTALLEKLLALEGQSVLVEQA